MAVDFKTFNSFVSLITDAKHPVMIRGRHGIGKSELVYALAAKMGMRVVERRVSQMSEGDLVGLPIVDGNRTSWNPPDWFKEACEEGVVLFLDEIDRGTQEVRQGCFQLTDSRACNGHKLHPDTLIFGAVNGGIHAAQYAVNDMDPAELDRWTVFDVEPTVEDWLTYATDNVHHLIKDYINDNRTFLEHTKEFEPSKVYPSRRSWKRLSDTVVKAGILSGDDYKTRLDIYFNIASGYVGMEAALHSRDYFKNLERVVSVDDILNGKLDGLKGYKLGEYVTLVDKVLDSEKVSAEMGDEKLNNLIRFFLKLPSEAAMKFYTGASGKKHLMNILLKMHGMTVDGVSIMAHVQKILGGSKKKA